jgi:LuxR family maltose regulon positive regulatory protein
MAVSSQPQPRAVGTYASRAEPAAGRPLLVPRPRLLDELTAQPAPVSLVSAPAGSGKTSLLRTLLSVHDMPTAWLDVGRVDDTASTLWAGILAALRATSVFSPSSRIHHLAPPGGTIDVGFVADVVGAVAQAGGRVRLVLDDLHSVRDQRTLESLDHLLARQPDELLLVFSSRHDPPLALHRLRLAGRLREIRRDDLAFSGVELQEVLERAGCALDATQVEQLRLRTEGWAAGIRIAVLALLEGADPDAFLDAFGGDDHALADYLVAEVLAHQPEELRSFLLATSICSTVPVQLAVRLTGRDDAGDVLEQLALRQALTDRLDRRREVYRYHAVLRTYLDAERRRRHPVEEAASHLIAGRWFAEQGDWLHALEHLGQADAPDEFLTLMRDHAITVIFDGQLSSLQRLLADLPTTLQDDAAVLLLRCLLALVEEGAAPADELLAGLDLDALLHDGDPWLAALAALVDVQRATLGYSLETALARLASRLEVPTGNVDLDLLVLHNWSLATLRTGERELADRTLRAVVDRARLGGRDALVVSCLCHLSVSSLMSEDLVDAEDLSRGALALADRRGWTRSDRTFPAHLVLAWVGYQRVERELSALHLGVALTSIGPMSDPRLVRSLALCQLLLRLDEGADAYTALRDHRARRTVREHEMSPILHAHVGPGLVRAALDIGETTWATEIVEEHGRPLVEHAEHALLRAMVLHAAGQGAAAERLIAPAIDGRSPSFLRGTLMRCHLLAGELALERAMETRAHDAVLAALRIADETGNLRPFLDAGPAVRQHVVTAADRSGRLATVAERVASLLIARSTGRTPLVLLTPTEASILRDLPSLLTIREIATARSVSTNTVKTHLSAMYRKLGVRSRREAVAVARARGLV